MKVSVGRTVICYGIESNGTLEHPAIVNRSWSGGDTAVHPFAINVTVFPDCGAPICVSSTVMHDTKEQAVTAYDAQVKAVAENTAGYKPHPVCYWPERV